MRWIRKGMKAAKENCIEEQFRNIDEKTKAGQHKSSVIEESNDHLPTAHFYTKPMDWSDPLKTQNPASSKVTRLQPASMQPYQSREKSSR